MKKVILRILLLLICASLATAVSCGRVKFTINFNSNGGTECVPIETLGNEVISMPKDPTKEGYEFRGWFWDDETFSRQFTVNSLLNEPLSSNMTVYAKWESIGAADNYITYSLNRFIVKLPEPLGDTVIDPDNMSPEDKQLYDTILSLYGKTVDIGGNSIKFSGSILSLYNPVEYTLNGETVSLTNSAISDVFTEVTLSGGKFSFGAVNSGMGFVFEYVSPDYVPETYTAQFDYAGADGSNTVQSKQIEEGKAFGELPTPTKTGYEFEGWFYFDKQITADSTYSFSNNITLSAKWEKLDDTDTNYVTYSINRLIAKFPEPLGDTVIDPSNMSTEETEIYDAILSLYGRSAQISSNAIRFSGTLLSLYNPVRYTLSGDNVILAGAAISDMFTETTLSNGKFTLGMVEDGIGFEFEYTSPDYVPETYTAQFDYAGADGGNTVQSKQIEEDENFGALPTPTKSGYEFGGWYYNDKLITENSIYSYKYDITLTAKWNIKTYSITYVLGGGLNAINNPITYTISDNITLYGASKTGHTFDGWYVESDFSGDKLTEIDATLCQDITLYAKFTAKTLTLTFDYGFDISGDIVTSKDMTYGSYMGELPAPERKGYYFDGWYTSDDNYYHAHSICDFESDTMLYAKWTIYAYNIAYFLNGGTNSNSNPKTYTIISDISLYDASLTGHTFDGWYSNSNFSGDKVTKIDSNLCRDIALYAKFTANTYTVTFDYGFAITGDVESTRQVTYNTVIGTLPFIDRPGYTFGGWKDSNGKRYYDTSVYSLAGDATLTAQWSEDVYQVRYVLNGGIQTNNNPSSFTVQSNFIIYNAQKTGYTFDGWYLTQDFAGDKITALSNGITESITLYAKFTANEYSLIFDYDGATCENEQESKTISYDGTFGELPNPKKTGYSFVGWYNGNTAVNSNTVYKNSSDMTITAKWSLITYNITYTLNGGTHLAGNPKTYTVLNVPTLYGVSKTGHTFDGWFLTSDFSGEPVQSLTGLAEHLSLHAKFTANTYTVTFDYADASGGDSVKSKNVVYGSAIGALPTPTNAPYIFGGWFTAANGGGTEWTATNNWNLAYNSVLYAYFGGTADLSYEKYNNNAYAVTGYSKSSAKVVIPKYYKGLSVTRINDRAFQNVTGLTDVYIGDNVTYIGANAFLSCSALIGISLPSALATIGNSAFDGCGLLANLTLPNSLTSIGESAFANCKALTRVDIPNKVETIRHYTFYGCSSLEEITFGNDVTSIGEYAFSNATALKRINSSTDGEFIIGNNVTYIGDGAFKGTNPISISLPFVGDGRQDSTITNVFGFIFGYTIVSNTVNPPDDTTFQHSYNGNYYWYFIPKNLTHVTVTNAKTIPSNAFYNCSWITDISINNGITSIGTNAFNNCKLVRDFTLPSSLTSIGDYAFYGCESLTTIEVPSNVTLIKDYSFANCSALEEVAFGDNVTGIGVRAFSGAIALKRVNSFVGGDFIIGNNVTYIGDGAFKGTNPISISLPFVGDGRQDSTITNVFGFIFGYTIVSNTVNPPDDTTLQYSYNGNYYRYFIPKNLTHVTVTNAKTIPSYAFRNCSWIADIAVNNGVTAIGNYAFNNCESLVAFDIPINIQTIGANAFQNCKLVREFIFPSSLTSIGDYAFYGCESLTTIEVPSNVTLIKDYTFANCSALEEVAFGDNVTSIGVRAFSGAIALKRVNSFVGGDFIIGNNVTYIGDGAFKGTSPISISLPFVGDGRQDSTITNVFGFIFGFIIVSNTVNPPDDTTLQYSYNGNYYRYFIPKNLTHVTITNARTIPANAFYNCSWITDISINDGVTSVGANAFNNCSSLTTFTAPIYSGYDASTLSYLAKYFGATEYNKSPNLVPASLTRFIINNSPAAISDYAFYGLSNILEITIPDSVQSIGYRSFYNCKSLISVNFSGSVPPELSEESFFGVTAAFRVPSGASLAYTQAFSGLSNEICESKGYVIFDTNGANAVAMQTLDGASPAARPQDPTRDNYIFRGWFIDKAMTTPYNFSDIVTGTVILYAKWEMPQILINKPIAVNIDKTQAYFFSFTPTTSGTFTFSSSASVKTQGTLYDSSGALIKNGTYDELQTNYKITVSLTAGATYTLKVWLADQTLTSDVVLVVRNG